MLMRRFDALGVVWTEELQNYFVHIDDLAMRLCYLVAS
jgi:hypothetical protein